MTEINKIEEELPYKEIGDYPEYFSQGNIIKRFIDGIGYRYYWATESLRESDLSYRISSDSRTLLETLEHILDISGFILRIAQQKYSGEILEKEELDFQEIRNRTLNFLKKASQLLSEVNDNEMKSFDIKIQQGNSKFTLPFWNTLNGPISDAIYHTGQIVAFRRALKNPISPNVDIFTGKNNRTI